MHVVLCAGERSGSAVFPSNTLTAADLFLMNLERVAVLHIEL